jgi:cytochrome c oxidase subunit 3
MAEAHQKNHDYHIIDPSPWPLLASIGAFVMAFGGVGYMRYLKGSEFHIFGMNLATPWVFYIGLAIVIYVMIGWWSDTIKEGNAGAHTRVVSLHLRYGMIMFIASEVMFFVAWFWAFFDASLYANEAIQASRTQVLGGQWPPKGIEVLHGICRSITRSSCCCRAPASPGLTTRCCTTIARASSPACR